MLVLRRRENESIQIGAAIRLTVIEIRGDKVRLGIDAPKATPIWRGEIWLKFTNNQNRESAAGVLARQSAARGGGP